MILELMKVLILFSLFLSMGGGCKRKEKKSIIVFENKVDIGNAVSSINSEIIRYSKSNINPSKSIKEFLISCALQEKEYSPYIYKRLYEFKEDKNHKISNWDIISKRFFLYVENNRVEKVGLFDHRLKIIKTLPFLDAEFADCRATGLFSENLRCYIKYKKYQKSSKNHLPSSREYLINPYKFNILSYSSTLLHKELVNLNYYPFGNRCMIGNNRKKLVIFNIFNNKLLKKNLNCNFEDRLIFAKIKENIVYGIDSENNILEYDLENNRCQIIHKSYDHDFRIKILSISKMALIFSKLPYVQSRRVVKKNEEYYYLKNLKTGKVFNLNHKRKYIHDLNCDSEGNICIFVSSDYFSDSEKYKKNNRTELLEVLDSKSNKIIQSINLKTNRYISIDYNNNNKIIIVYLEKEIIYHGEPVYSEGELFYKEGAKIFNESPVVYVPIKKKLTKF